jgi:hypothetical protein
VVCSPRASSRSPAAPRRDEAQRHQHTDAAWKLCFPAAWRRPGTGAENGDRCPSPLRCAEANSYSRRSRKGAAMDEPEEVPFHPPDAVTVARRALILCGVVCRANLEYDTDKAYRRQTAADVSAWLTDLDLWPYVEPDEDKIFCTPFGKLSPSRSAKGRGSWRDWQSWRGRCGGDFRRMTKGQRRGRHQRPRLLSPEAADCWPGRRSAMRRNWRQRAVVLRRPLHPPRLSESRRSWPSRLVDRRYLKVLGVEPSAVMVKGYLAFEGDRSQGSNGRNWRNGSTSSASGTGRRSGLSAKIRSTRTYPWTRTTAHLIPDEFSPLAR